LVPLLVPVIHFMFVPSSNPVLRVVLLGDLMLDFIQNETLDEKMSLAFFLAGPVAHVNH
jgi:hypothetical protein